MEDTILSKLHLEHKEIEHDLNLILRMDDENEKQKLFAQIKRKIVDHLEGEEYSIYRHFREDVREGANLDFVMMSDSEHHTIKEYLQRLTLLSIKSPLWNEYVYELSEVIKIHVMEEEDGMFTEAKDDFSKEELIQFGTEFENFKSHTH